MQVFVRERSVITQYLRDKYKTINIDLNYHKSPSSNIYMEKKTKHKKVKNTDRSKIKKYRKKRENRKKMRAMRAYRIVMTQELTNIQERLRRC